MNFQKYMTRHSAFLIHLVITTFLANISLKVGCMPCAGATYLVGDSILLFTVLRIERIKLYHHDVTRASKLSVQPAVSPMI